MYHLFNNYGGKDMMYRTELLEEITIENATVKINAKIEEMSILAQLTSICDKLKAPAKYLCRTPAHHHSL